MVARLIRIYTPFICSIVAIIHGVLFLRGYDGMIYSIFSDITGHSILLISFVLATSKRMCRWYRYTCWLLLLVHFVNLLYYFGADYFKVVYAGLVINFISLITFLIYRLKVGITKILC